MHKYHTQNNEGEIIDNYFGDFKGRLLDIGANDGITLSNSYDLIQKGWSGDLIEPSKAYFKLSELYKDNDNVNAWYMGISTFDGSGEWFEGEDSLLSTGSAAFASTNRTGYNKTKTEFVTFNTFLYQSGNHKYDFISIDAEGQDYAILSQIDLTECKLLCIEYGEHLKEITAYAERFGMRSILRNCENLIFVK